MLKYTDIAAIYIKDDQFVASCLQLFEVKNLICQGFTTYSLKQSIFSVAHRF